MRKMIEKQNLENLKFSQSFHFHMILIHSPKHLILASLLWTATWTSLNSQYSLFPEILRNCVSQQQGHWRQSHQLKYQTEKNLTLMDYEARRRWIIWERMSIVEMFSTRKIDQSSSYSRFTSSSHEAVVNNSLLHDVNDK